jgi:hypothetical protein
MRVFVTKAFNRFARSERIWADRLLEAVGRAGRGLVDADLGGGLIKQRVARPGQGRSGGYRTVIAFRRLDRAVFLHGFAKSERDNIKDADLARLKRLAGIFLNASAKDLERWCERGELEEVRWNG